MSEQKIYGPRGSFAGVITELWDWPGKGPKKGFIECCDAIDRTGELKWSRTLLVSWDKELPAVGTAVQVIGRFVCEEYGGKLRDQLVVADIRPKDLPAAFLSIPLPPPREPRQQAPAPAAPAPLQAGGDDDWGF